MTEEYERKIEVYEDSKIEQLNELEEQEEQKIKLKKSEMKGDKD